MDNIKDTNSKRDLHPKSAEARFLQLPTVPQQAALQCEACGSELSAKQVEMFGAIRYVPSRCSCQGEENKARQAMIEEQRAVILEARSRHTYTWLGGRFTDASLAEKTFENFDKAKQPKAYQAALAFVALLASDPHGKGTLVLDGTFGTGKTHLLAAVCNALLMKPKPVTSLFTTSANLFAVIQKRIGDNEDFQGIISRAVSASLLVIDDIDKTKWTEWREEIYFSIVDERTKRCLPMAISTNKLDDIHLYTGGAVASRLKIRQIAIEMIGEDYRKEL
jgi:DNA replication protein DnaC